MRQGFRGGPPVDLRGLRATPVKTATLALSFSISQFAFVTAGILLRRDIVFGVPLDLGRLGVLGVGFRGIPAIYFC